MPDDALSEIVGGLLLVLVVAVAATSFGAFLHERQSVLEEQSLLETRRAFERVEFLRLVPSGAGPTWSSLSLTVANVRPEPVDVASVALNGHHADSFTAWRTDPVTGILGPTVTEGSLRLEAREQAAFVFEVPSDFFDAFTVAKTEVLRFQATTGALNAFERTYVPPVALGVADVAEQWNGAAFEPVVVLDGTRSEGLDVPVVAWSWSLQPDGTTAEGRRARAPFAATGIDHTVTLTVRDADGLVATDVFTVFH